MSYGLLSNPKARKKKEISPQDDKATALLKNSYPKLEHAILTLSRAKEIMDQETIDDIYSIGWLVTDLSSLLKELKDYAPEKTSNTR